MDIERLVVMNMDWIRMKARLYYVDEDDAEDLAGETVLKLLTYSKHFDTERAFRPWAKTIMKNTFITQYNRRKLIPFYSFDDNRDGGAMSQAEQSLMVGQILSAVRKCARKSCCIRSVMLYAEGYSYAEIAQKERIHEGTVKSRVLAGRRMIQRELA